MNRVINVEDRIDEDLAPAKTDVGLIHGIEKDADVLQIGITPKHKAAPIAGIGTVRDRTVGIAPIESRPPTWLEC